MIETMNRPEVLTQQEVDAEFIGMVANMNTVTLNVASVSPVFEMNKSTKFGANLSETSVNTDIAIEGGMSLADQEALKGDIANKFDPAHIAQLRAQETDHFFSHVVLNAEDTAKKTKKKTL